MLPPAFPYRDNRHSTSRFRPVPSPGHGIHRYFPQEGHGDRVRLVAGFCGRPDSRRRLRVLPKIRRDRLSEFYVFENAPNLPRRLDRGGKLLIELRRVPIDLCKRKYILRQREDRAVSVLMWHEQ